MREISFPYIEASWFVALLLPLIFIRVNKWLAPFFIYSWASAIYIGENVFHRVDFPMKVILAAENGAWSYMALLLIFAYMMKCHIPNSRIEKFLAWLGAFNICLTVALTPINHPFISGLVFNKSTNAIFNLMLIPFVMVELRSVMLLFFCIATVFYSGSSAAVLALAVMGCYFFRRNVLACGLFALACALARTVMHKPFNYLDRIHGYRYFFRTFTKTDWIIGRGPGSFFTFSVYEQVRDGFEISKDLKWGNGLFIWLHNDPLQALYEHGAIGWLCLIPALIWVYKHTEKAPFYSVLALFCGSFFYYPFHWSLHLIVIFCLLKITDNNYKVTHE